MTLIFGRASVVNFVSLLVFVAVNALYSILAPKLYIFCGAFIILFYFGKITVVTIDIGYVICDDFR